MRNNIPLQFLCGKCRKQFERSLSKITGVVAYCSNSCASSVKKSKQVDEYSPFRRHLEHALRRASKKNVPFSITLEELKDLWDKQKGICSYTGWPMDNPLNASHKKGDRVIHTKRASLDRVDPCKGYTIDNCEWVCYIVNCMKNSFSREEVISTAKAIVKQIL